MAALLEARHLRVDLHTQRGTATAVRDVSFTLERGDTLGLIGESGCGKSLTALALIGLQPEGARVSGSLRLDGQELVGLADRGWRRLRGNRIAIIFQEPMTALNPVHRVGAQIAEPLRLHRGLGAQAAREKAIALMARVGIPEPARRVDSFPHQFSGGQRQRLMIAMALACEPDVLIADEPTTALDVTVQQQILALIRELVAERGMALVLISHDLGLIAQNARQMLVMYGGAVVESGPAASVFHHPAHPYTRGLLAARPSLAQRLVAHRGDRLPTIPGTVPDLFHLPPGCPFAGRCPFTEDPCFTDTPPRVDLDARHRFWCRRAQVVLRAAGLADEDTA
ncbi:MAG TPA: ABC transporter ATP-binding protein [Ottowia sp.]|uniref:ABC transporter ATP-binding protein n=1 Tax=Ottowia sp. TaxID=1898956 RepID=UPI002C827F78|nr:ABC transporter ATP-binding protein [Ottowia sp.]HMN21644.1 ABC transporter ATP-binding protein [Ottowia sp.]